MMYSSGGNHANTMYPDPRFATVDGKRATDVFDSDWLKGEFLDTVATRQSQLSLEVPLQSPQAHRSLLTTCVTGGRVNGRIVSMALPSEGWYGVPEGLVFKLPM